MRSSEGGGWTRANTGKLATYPTARPDLKERCGA